MIKTTYYCDRCKLEMDMPIYKTEAIILYYDYGNDYSRGGNVVKKKYELCNSCLEKYKNFLGEI